MTSHHWYRTDEEKLISPCIHNCSLIPGTRTCGGCYRNADECKQWRKLTVSERRQILVRAQLRKRQYLESDG